MRRLVNLCPGGSQPVIRIGQSYVALSRAASLDGLQVLGFDAKKVCHLRFSSAHILFICMLQVKAHPKVIEWSLSLEKEHT